MGEFMSKAEAEKQGANPLLDFDRDVKPEFSQMKNCRMYVTQGCLKESEKSTSYSGLRTAMSMCLCRCSTRSSR